MNKLFAILTLLLVSTIAANAQHNGTIRGAITTTDNKPAEGVTVILKNTSKASVADNSGRFEIKNVSAGEYTLLVSLIGYKDEERQVIVNDSTVTTMDLQLLLSNKQLNEVVVTANKNSFKTNRVSNSLRLQ